MVKPVTADWITMRTTMADVIGYMERGHAADFVSLLENTSTVHRSHANTAASDNVSARIARLMQYECDTMRKALQGDGKLPNRLSNMAQTMAFSIACDYLDISRRVRHHIASLGYATY